MEKDHVMERNQFRCVRFECAQSMDVKHFQVSITQEQLEVYTVLGIREMVWLIFTIADVVIIQHDAEDSTWREKNKMIWRNKNLL